MTYNISGIVQRLRRRCGPVPAFFIPFLVKGQQIGWLAPAMVQQLKRWPYVFQFDEQGAAFSSQFEDCGQRTEVMEWITKRLHSDGWFKDWRNELVTVQSENLPLLSIERGALRRFGITLYSTHLNGLYFENGPGMWLARRNSIKAIDPGCYDTLVGGGLGNGLDVMETLIKESWEEAGIAADIVARAELKRIVRVGRLVEEGWHDEVIYAHDLSLPVDFSPTNNDGEVSAFQRFSLDEVISLLTYSDDLTVEASFVVCDYLLRTGHIGRDAGYSELCHLIYE